MMSEVRDGITGSSRYVERISGKESQGVCQQVRLFG